MNKCPKRGHLIKSTHRRVPRPGSGFASSRLVSVVMFSIGPRGGAAGQANGTRQCKHVRRLGAYQHQKLAPGRSRLDKLNFWGDYMLSPWAYTHEKNLAGSWLIGIDVGAAPRADSAELPAKGARYVQADQTEHGICPRGRWLVI